MLDLQIILLNSSQILIHKSLHELRDIQNYKGEFRKNWKQIKSLIN